MATKVQGLVNSLLVQSCPKLNVFVKYALVELTTLSPKGIPAIRHDVKPQMGKSNIPDFIKNLVEKRPRGSIAEENPLYWTNHSQNEIRKLLKNKSLPIRAKNIILFVGDGMSLPTVTAARIYKEQKNGKTGESSSLSFDNFQHTGITKTYCVDSMVADSACTATAYLCGVKTNFFALGVNGKTNILNCSSAMDPANQVDSIVSWAQEAGKCTGIVTTTTVTHASPGGAYAKIANRFYESDLEVKLFEEDPKTCQDIASQLIENQPGRDINVIMGGGRTNFLPNTDIDSISGKPGKRLDGKNLIEKWKKNNPNQAYVTNRDELLNIDLRKTSKILGLFQPQHLDFNLNRDNKIQPSLEEMTESAIKLLSKNPKGYFLFVEGGRIDHAHHLTQTHMAIDETIQFEKAIKKARDMTNPLNTLIVVTSDHSHTMSISGYPKRNNDILGVNEGDLASDGVSYFILNYANGPENYLNNGKRYNISDDLIKDPGFLYPSYVPMEAETHGGDDVAVFADGPYSHFFSGVYEQNDIPHKLAFASCIGRGITHCRRYPLK
ncbi:alkaline phosphatase-like [Condylostylus longicornis]|uniref:alkaline phosphatase-like n=1 Tax=Condylostylus longicornis TaxID=2530218 RepID=UPI00244E0662|nr:alkaline phosphatase-like [Condylostylus longicornis]